MFQYCSSCCFCCIVHLFLCVWIAPQPTHPPACRCPPLPSVLSNTSFLKRFLSAKCFYGQYDCRACVCVVCVRVSVCVCVCAVLCVHCIAGIIDTFNFTIMPFCCHHIRISIINRFVFKFSFGDCSVCLFASHFI